VCRRFNPRPRAAGDATSSAALPYWIVSIHARARRATRLAPRFGGTSRRFNPRPRAAGDGAALNSFANKVQGDLNRGSAAAAAGDTVLLATTILYVLVKERLRIFANLAVACGALQVRDAYRTSV